MDLRKQGLFVWKREESVCLGVKKEKLSNPWRKGLMGSHTLGKTNLNTGSLQAALEGMEC